MFECKRVSLCRCVAIFLLLGIFCPSAEAQTKVYPAVEGFGGIYAVDSAEVRPNGNLEYKIVVDVKTGSPDPAELNPALHNVARLMNLHIEGGANYARMHVVLAVHAGAAYALLEDKAYLERYGIENPNAELIEALQGSRVDFTICGQSMVAREIQRDQLLDGVKVATSMLTTVTTYQSLGYSFLQF